MWRAHFVRGSWNVQAEGTFLTGNGNVVDSVKRKTTRTKWTSAALHSSSSSLVVITIVPGNHFPPTLPSVLSHARTLRRREDSSPGTKTWSTSSTAPTTPSGAPTTGSPTAFEWSGPLCAVSSVASLSPRWGSRDSCYQSEAFCSIFVSFCTSFFFFFFWSFRFPLSGVFCFCACFASNLFYFSFFQFFFKFGVSVFEGGTSVTMKPVLVQFFFSKFGVGVFEVGTSLLLL